MGYEGCMKIIEVCRVTPLLEDHSTTITAPKSLPLTFFDLLWLRFHPQKCLFFYQLPPTRTISFLEAILPNLKTSLALALGHYLPLAGNLVWPEQNVAPTIEFVEGNGVVLTVAEADANADFEHLSGNGFREVEEYHSLIPKLDVSHDHAAILAIQITMFGKSGFSIGVSSHHAVLDGKTLTTFLKFWARLCHLHVTTGSSTPLPLDLMPFYDRSVIKDTKRLAGIYANEWLKDEGPNNRSLRTKVAQNPPARGRLIRCSIEFTKQNMEKLREWVVKEVRSEKENEYYISSFALTYGYLCACTAKLDGLKDGKLGFAFAADARSRLRPSVPLNYFGNCVGGRVFFQRKELLGNNGLIFAIHEISKAVKSLEGDILDGFENLCSFIIGSMGSGDDDDDKIYSIAGSPRFQVYSADFGWGNPRKVEFVSPDESTTTFCLLESPNGDGGIQIGLVKEKHEMERFLTLFAEGLQSDNYFN